MRRWEEEEEEEEEDDDEAEEAEDEAEDDEDDDEEALALLLFASSSVDVSKSIIIGIPNLLSISAAYPFNLDITCSASNALLLISPVTSSRASSSKSGSTPFRS